MRIRAALTVTVAMASAASIALACTSFSDAEDTGTEAPAPDAGSDTTSLDGAADASAAACTFFGGEPAACAAPKHVEARFTTGAPDGFNVLDDVSFDPGPGFCTPGFLHAQADVVAPKNVSGGRVSTTITGAFKSVRVAYALRGPRDLFPNTYVELGCEVWLIAAQGVGTVMHLDVRNGGGLNHSATALGDAAAGDDIHLAVLDPQQTGEERARFRKLEATYSWGAPGSDSVKTSLAFDGEPEQHPTYPLLAPVTSIRVTCGVAYADQSTATHVADIDDVVIDACE